MPSGPFHSLNQLARTNIPVETLQFLQNLFFSPWIFHWLCCYWMKRYASLLQLTGHSESHNLGNESFSSWRNFWYHITSCSNNWFLFMSLFSLDHSLKSMISFLLPFLVFWITNVNFKNVFHCFQKRFMDTRTCQQKMCSF